MTLLLIQVVLLGAVVGMLVLFVRKQHGVRMKASKRLAFLLFLGANVYAVLRPDHVTAVANLLGVGRGTDLLLYLLIVAFVFAVFNFYLRMREGEQRVTALARQVALRDAELLNRYRGLLGPIPPTGGGPAEDETPPAERPVEHRP